MTTIYGNASGSTASGAQVYTPPSGLMDAVSPTAPLQVLGNDGAGNIASANLVAGTDMTITQTGNNITFASTSGATSGNSGINSPTQLINGTFASDVLITTAYVTDNPTLAQMQTIDSVTINPFYSSANGTGSVVEITACVPFSSPVGSALGTQFALFASTDTSTPLYAPTPNSQGVVTISNDNYSSASLSYQIPSVAGVPVTIYLAASYTISPNVTVFANGYNFFCAEVLPSTPSVVSTTEIVLPTSNITSSSVYTGTSQTYGATTSIVSQSFKKQYFGSQLNFKGALQMQALSANQQYFGAYLLYVSPSSASLASAIPYNVIQNSGKGGTGSLSGKAAFLGAQGVVDYMLFDGNAGAGTYNIAIGSTYKGSAYQYTSAGSSLYVQEVLPASSTGFLQSYSFSNVSTNTTPYVNSTSPQFSQGELVATWTVENKAGGSTLYFTGTAGTGGLTGSAEGQISFNFYTSNSPTATPFFTTRPTAPSSNVAVQNTTFIEYCAKLTSGSAYTPTTVYVTVTSLTSSQPAQNAQLTANFQEIYIGSTTSGVTSVTASSGSYVTASTVNGAVTIGSQKASTSQDGLVAVNAVVPINTVFRVNNAGQIVATTAPQFPSFGANLRIAYGGASVGQVVGNQIGDAVYENMGASQVITVGATPITCFKVDCLIVLNITTEGTSTGTATITGLPFTPLGGLFTTPFYVPCQQISGTTIPNSSTLSIGIIGGSNVIGLYVYDLNTETYTPATNANFSAANIQIRAAFSAYIATPPTT